MTSELTFVDGFANCKHLFYIHRARVASGSSHQGKLEFHPNWDVWIEMH